MDTKYVRTPSKIVHRGMRIGLCRRKEGSDPCGLSFTFPVRRLHINPRFLSLRVLGLAGIHSLWRRVDGDIILGAYRILAQQSDTLRTPEFRSWKVGRPAYCPPRMVELASDSWNDLRWKVGHSTEEFGVFLEPSGRSWQCSY